MRAARVTLAALVLVVTVTAQQSALPYVAIVGVTCDLTLIAVVGLALSRGAEFGALAGFAGGLLLDLVPPADHTAGRWALSLALAGYLGGLLRRDAAIGPWQVGLSVLACTVSAHVVFAATGSLLRDPDVQAGDLGRRLGVAVGYDLLVAIVVVPLLIWLVGKLDSAGERRWPEHPRMPL